MALKKYKPITAGTRWRIGNAYAEITTNVPEKTLVETKKNTAGRNSSGRMTMRYRGGAPDSAIDKLARERLSTVYMPGG